MNETLLNMELNKSEYDIYKILKELKKEKILPGIWKLLLDDSVLNKDINFFRRFEIENNYPQDYYLALKKGPVKLFHYSKDIHSLIDNGYSIEGKDLFDLSVGLGIYCLKEVPENLIEKFNLILYNDFYFEFIYSKVDDKDKNEIFIPYQLFNKNLKNIKILKYSS